MVTSFALLFLFGVSVAQASLAVSSYYTDRDRLHAKKILLDAFKSDDPAYIHHGSLGLRFLKEPLPSGDEPCNIILKAASDSRAAPAVLYNVVMSHKTIGNCKQPLPVINIVKSLNEVLARESNLQELFYATRGLTALDQKPSDPAKLIKAIQSLLKKNDSLLNFAYYFHISADLGLEAAKTAFSRVEDVIVQADEVDSKFLQYEGGLSTTALIVNGIFRVANVVDKAPPLTNEQATKFANYFLSRSYVQTAKGVASLLESLTNLSNNKFQVPVAISLASSRSMPVSEPKISVKVSDVLGKDLGKASVTAGSINRDNGDVVRSTKRKFSETAEKTVFTSDLKEENLERGKYKISVSATINNADARFPTAAESEISFNLLSSVLVDFIDIGTVDSDQTTQGKLIRVPFAEEANQVIEGDSQQKVQVRFTLKDKASGKLLTVHQAFVRFSRLKTDESAVFIAEPDSTGQYRLDLDIGGKSADFGHISGEYNVELVVGDALLVNPISWKFARVNLKLLGEAKPPGDQYLYKPKPEIQHMFREPEKRPLRFVSDLFSLLAILPLFVLLVLWVRLRINIAGSIISIWSVIFHLSLGCIFLLFGLFWLKLNMFQTVRYLVCISLVTFLSGNKLLRKVSERKQK